MATTKIARVGAFFAGTAGVLSLAACGNGANQAANTPSVPSTSATSAASSDTPSGASSATSQPSAPASAPAQPAANGLCRAGDVKLSLGQGDAGAGSAYRPLLITNVSSHPCTIQGFPGVSYVAGADGHQVGNPAFREGAKGDAVKLAPGQQAAADLQFVNVQNFDSGACKPTGVKGLRVYLPQETASNFLADPGTGCAGTGIPGNQLSVKTVHRA